MSGTTKNLTRQRRESGGIGPGKQSSMLRSRERFLKKRKVKLWLNDWGIATHKFQLYCSYEPPFLAIHTQRYHALFFEGEVFVAPEDLARMINRNKGLLKAGHGIRALLRLRKLTREDILYLCTL